MKEFSEAIDADGTAKEMLYPILFAPLYKEMVWGGKRMAEKFGRQLPSHHTGESWDITCRPKEMGQVENGVLAGQSFDAVIRQNPAGILGTRVCKDWEQDGFPLLVKIIDANDDLSVQVHPDDAYAAKAEPGGRGKSEMWYVMDAPSKENGGSLVIGLADKADRQSLQEAPMSVLHRLPVQKGDIINIPAGLVHAITKGVMVAEIQQNSDITYRLYDYERLGLDGKPRELHVAQGLEVSDFDNKHPKAAVAGLTVTEGDARITYAIANPYFAVLKYEVSGTYAENSNPEAFTIFTCVEGECDINGVTVACSRSVFIPAGLGEYTIRSQHCVLLKSFVPDVQQDFVAPLQAKGFTGIEKKCRVALS